MIANFTTYVQRKDDKEQSLIDAVILSNFNSDTIRLIAFDFSLNCDHAIQEFSSHALDNMTTIEG
jgi:hypothetical protein